MESIQLPAIYIGHGAPTVAIEQGQYQTDIATFAKNIPDPTTIVVVSAHWQQHIPIQITSSKLPGIIYDYYGFPEIMYQLQYNAPGNPNVAQKITQMLIDHGITAILNPKQGLDHGAWIPLRFMYPDASIPVIQISIPIRRTPSDLFKIGKIIAPLRDHGILLMGSGNLVHNLPHAMQHVQKAGKFESNSPAEPWAKETDHWLKDKLNDFDIKTILQSPEKAPHFQKAAPTTEHFDPLYFVLGTAHSKEGINHFHESFQAGSISMRSFALEA